MSDETLISSSGSPTEPQIATRSTSICYEKQSHDSLDDINRCMKSMGREVMYVPGDGHCLLNAVEKCIAFEKIGQVTHGKLCDGLMNEVRSHTDFPPPPAGLGVEFAGCRPAEW